MSSSAISAAKRRTEISLRGFDIPTTTEPNDNSNTPREQVLLSLLQSRLNWSTNVFLKYRTDDNQQPKRKINIRKRFPMMQYLGQCTLELGPHLFPETSIYQAIRYDSWVDLGKKAGLNDIETIIADILANNSDLATSTTAKNNDIQEQNNSNNLSKKSESTTDINNNDDNNSNDNNDNDNDNDNNNTKNEENQHEENSDNTNTNTNNNTSKIKTTTTETSENVSIQPNVNINASETNPSQGEEPLTQDSNITQFTSSVTPKENIHHHHQLVYNDVVIEFKDLPSERYLFPKEAILEVVPSEIAPSIKASFLLPLDPTSANHFFWDATKKIKYFGEQSTIPIIQEAAKRFQTEIPDDDNDQIQYQPVNIRVLDASNEIISALNSSIYNADYVRSKMIKKMRTIPTRKYLDYQISKNDLEAIHELIQRMHTLPDITSGPIAAEKKRNEISLAIKLGKRPASDQHEAEPPRTKQNQIGKEDGLKKCVYCSTRHTTMWRRGPAGGGTLCNGCGILWQQGKILKGAPVISKEEEKQKIKNKWERDYYQRQQLEWELERRRIREEKELALRKEHESNLRLEALKQKRALALQAHNNKHIKNEKHRNETHSEKQTFTQSSSSVPNNMNSDTHQPMSIDTNANTDNNVSVDQNAKDSQSVSSTSLPQNTGKANTQQQSNKNAKRSTKSSAKKEVKENKPTKSTTSTTTAINNNNSNTKTSTASVQTTTSSSSSSSYHIFNLPLIPLPTLCIEFADTMFSHPNCTASISQQKHFTIYLSKDDANITINIPKAALTNSKFEILGQIDSAGRDILLMSCQPNDVGFGIDKPLEAFGSVLYDPHDDNHKQLNIRFLEKIDSFGGPVVKKILECWLAGVSNLN